MEKQIICFLFCLTKLWSSPVLNTPQELTVQENHAVTFTCTDALVKESEPIIWNRNNSPVGAIKFNKTSCQLVLRDEAISKSERYIIMCERQGSTLTTTLVIPAENVTEYEHNTMWYCARAGSINTSNYTRLFISVPVQQVYMKMTYTANEIYVSPGVPSTLRCTTGLSRPKARIEWYENGANVTDSKATTSYMTDGSNTGDKWTTTSLYVINKGTGNVTIVCKAANIDEVAPVESNAVTTVFIATPLEDPIITSNINESSLYEGNIVYLTCTHRGGNPPPRLIWGGICAGQTTRDIITPGFVRSQARVKATRELHQKKCSCLSSHPRYPFGSARTVDLTFNVKYSPTNGEPVIIEGYSTGSQLLENNSLSLSCQQQHGNPRPAVSWNCPGIEFIPKSHGDGMNNITLNITHRMDGKTCICNAHSSDPGLAYHGSNGIQFTVHYSPIIKSNKDRTFIEGFGATVECEAKGNPSPSIFWSHKGKNVSSSGILTLNNINRRDSGKYICHASANSPLSPNPLQTSKTMHIEVHYPPEIQIITPYSKEYDRIAKIICKIDSNPTSNVLSWTQVINNVTIRDFPLPSNASVLTLTNVSFHDIGDYICTASNGIPNKRERQHGRGFFNVHFSPKLFCETSNQTETFYPGEDGPFMVDIPVLSAPFIKKSSLVWINESCPEQKLESTNVTFTITNTTIECEFYGKQVQLYGQIINIEMLSFKHYHQGKYTVKANGSIFKYELLLSRIPDSLSNTRVSCKTRNSFVVRWTAGFNGGHEQTFVIILQYRNGRRIIEVQDIGIIIYEVFIGDIKPGKIYNVTLYATNKIGNSSMTFISNIEIYKGETRQRQLTFGEGVGTGIGICVGLCTVLCVIFVLAFGGTQNKRNVYEDVAVADVNRQEYMELGGERQYENAAVEETTNDAPIEDQLNTYEDVAVADANRHVVMGLTREEENTCV